MFPVGLKAATTFLLAPKRDIVEQKAIEKAIHDASYSGTGFIVILSQT